MGDLSAKRFLLLLAVLLTSVSALASSPSGRSQTRMAYDPITRRMILFGGVSGLDQGTQTVYYFNDTWAWNGARWTQLFPAHKPAARSGHALAYDSLRNRILLFGGHTTSGDLNDTWSFDGTDWTQINTPNSPPARFLHGGAYDSTRDRFVIFGGVQFSADGKTQTILYDTWEFDGTTWRQIGGEGPKVSKPAMAYDEARQTMLMVGIDDLGATLMYSYNGAAGTWTKLTPSTLPACANEGVMTYDTTKDVVVFTNGVCSTADVENETLEWNGTNWNKVTVKANAFRVASAALAYDPDREALVLFGGSTGSGPLNLTYVLRGEEWRTAITDDSNSPGARSLFTFTTDPINKIVYLFGGTGENGLKEDFWKFQNGMWQMVAASESAPADCATPNAAYDVDRQRLVVVCATSATFEYDGTAWKKIDGLKTLPPFRRFSSMTYDQSIKKTVLFGGFDANSNYLNETWTWNGTAWARVRNNPAPLRILASMWFDPVLKKTVLYGGLGRLTRDDRLTRFDDMWSFDGNGWTQIKPAGGTPGARYGAQVAVDPRTSKVILFGGLRLDTVPPTGTQTTPKQVQVYADDMWEWNGSVWTKLTPANTPPARENGQMTYDPTLDRIVLYGGYAGYFLSDLWVLGPDNTWTVRPEVIVGGRKRAVGK